MNMKILMSMGMAAAVISVAWGQETTAPQPGTASASRESERQGVWEPLDLRAPAGLRGEVEVGTQPEISDFQKASTFLGLEVKGAKNKTLGRVQDLVFDLDSGRLGYVVLETENAGMKRTVPVPLSAVKPADGGGHLVLNMSEPLLAAAVGVEETELPPLNVFEPGGGEEAIGAPASTETETKTEAENLPKRVPRTEAVKSTRSQATSDPN